MMIKNEEFFNKIEETAQDLVSLCKKYRNGIPENRENILELIMITAECLFGDIVFYKTRIDLEERKELIELEMEKKARKEITD